MSEPVIIVTGATGLLGPYLLDHARQQGRAYGLARSGADVNCDLTDLDAVTHNVADIAPDIIIHAAAESDVDVCERDPDAADRINRGATENIVNAMPDNAFLVYFSTIAVYPDTAGPHVEGTENPVNVYGRTKLAGEQAARTQPKSLVIRTAMFGPSRNPGRMSLSDFIVAGLRDGRSFNLFGDELFSPLHVDTLAGLTLDAVEAGLSGTFNAASHDGMSKAEFGFAIAGALKLPTDGIRVSDSRQVSSRTRRALDMRLDPSRLESALGKTMPSLEQEIARL